MEQIKQFYRDIGDVCIKHNISGVAGMWLSGEGNDKFGQLVFNNPADSRTGVLMGLIADKYAEWTRDVLKHVPKPIGTIREVRRSDNDTADN